MKKIKSMMLFVLFCIIILIPSRVHAGYQSKPGIALTNTTADTFFVGCRNMETAGGVLGLEEGLNSDYTGTSANGIDAHMALNTEWGTIALFTNSQYGVKTGISGTNSSSTSTGNATGIYGLANGVYEYVASTYEGTTSSYNKIIRGANARYFNSYSSKTPKAGDALQCKKWLGASYAYWTHASGSVFLRGCNGLFGFSNPTGNSNGSYCTRAVVVCGAGL